MGIHAGNIQLNFEASEYIALCELAQKLHTDVGSVLRIGGMLAIEADRRGLLKIAATNPGAALAGGSDAN